jgi:heat shock protein HtpX
MTAPNLFEQQASNRRRSFWLVTGFVLFFAWVGFGGDIAWYLMSAPSDGPEATSPREHSSRHTVPFIGIVTTLIAGGICWYSWKKGADRVLWATGAKEIFEPSNDLEQRLINVVEEMAIAAGLPRPRVFVVPDPDPNAFATGIEPGKACIAVTQGLLERLDRDELQGVVAHELAHVQNFDTRLMTLLAAMVGAIALMSDGMGRMLRFGNLGGRGGGRGKGGKGGNPLAIIVLVLWVITLILAPIIARFLAMAVSRKREYLADATGAQFTRNPLALAEALEKLDQAAEPTRAITQGAAHLCIVDPSASQISTKEGFLGDVFSSHPPIRQRVARLRGMGYQLAKQRGNPLPK